jgi:hypothetical protein
MTRPLRKFAWRFSRSAEIESAVGILPVNLKLNLPTGCRQHFSKFARRDLDLPFLMANGYF